MNLIFKTRKLLCSISFLLLITTKLNSAMIDSITITGNSRITDQTIMTFLPVKINDVIDDNTINEITKKLYETNFFKNLTVNLKENQLIIDVIENPIIQNIYYNGIKSTTLKDYITKDNYLIPRSSFIMNIVNKDLDLMKGNLKNRGYYFSNIKLKIEELDDNIVNIYYDFQLGNKSKIKKISFLGNKVFKDKKLKNVILSEEYKFWKFISGKKFLNQELVDFDKRLLRNFFLNNGYYNVSISSSFAKLLNDDEFELIYNIDAGSKIYFGILDLNLPIDYDEKNFIKLNATLKNLENKPYSINSLEKITEDIELLVLNEQYETIDIDIIENFKGDKLNLKFLIKETDKINIKKINVLGNNITQENVIRNNFEIDEGDLFNKILYNKTINNLKSLNYFKQVEGEVLNDSNSTGKIINIKVEEKPTGEIGASAGVGTNGNSIGFFVRENNYLGRGILLNSNITISTDSLKGLLSVNNPNFNDTDKSLYGTIEATELDKLKSSGFKTNRTGFSYGTRFEYLNDLNLGIGNKNFYQKIETDSTASSLQQKQEGDYLDSFLNLSLDYDKRNQRFKTSDGFFASYSVDFPIVSDTDTITNTIDYKYYTELFEDNVTSIGFYASASKSYSNKNIKLTERNFLPGSRLRGFGPGSIGPKDGNDFIGGNYASSININTTLPFIFETNQNLDFLYFIDLGNVWGVDYNSSLKDSNKIRSSTGIGVDWLTPIGPLSFTLSQPITKADTDSTENFRFNLGTSF
jgi:outer membrane protein insertion porin family